ncbi:chemotaxis protein CheW [Roseomonas marmotae]|uniref:Chemotaxis protein CheW n=1 Tax=Roseomonas marmotae TaxID=2768161 RepID=A0ABS3K772_9PROT|nr:chemotaxis protein CheW [Roseomonas marmotae]MBO1073298.1 chemotaxis protein CheW [Roseomonas marmotae]QTI79084.1 chemotaxis protein CheW [Roseomonas marmotae]
MSAGTEPLDGLMVAGQVFRLPPGARAVPPPTPRPLPGAPPEMLGVALLEGRLLPAWAGEAAPMAWVLLKDGLIGGSGFHPAPPGAPLLRLPEAPPLPPPAPAAAAAPPPPPSLPPPPSIVVLRLSGATMGLPMAALRCIRAWPEQILPVPGSPPGLLGYATTPDGPALLLEAGWCYGVANPGPPSHLALLRHQGRQLGLPCQGAAPGQAAPLLPRLDGTPEGARILALAPCPAEAPPPIRQPRRPLLLCKAGSTPFCLPMEEIVAVIPPQRLLPLPPGTTPGMVGACAHRGAVLPVLDAGWRLGHGRLPPAPPLLHLAGDTPWALAVAEVLGLRQVPEAGIFPVTGDPLVAGLASIEGQPVPLCRAAGFIA